MACAPETGFYFEPLSERLALVVEGSPFPSDDHWAFVGDPLEMTPELARLEVANRWPGIDPEGLEVEFDTNFERTVAEIERLRLSEGPRQPGEVDFDVNFLLSQAEALKAAAAALQVPGAKDVEEALEKDETVGDAIARAHDK